MKTDTVITNMKTETEKIIQIVPVSGEIKWAGLKLDDGSIEFEPIGCWALVEENMVRSVVPMILFGNCLDLITNTGNLAECFTDEQKAGIEKKQASEAGRTTNVSY